MMKTGSQSPPQLLSQSCCVCTLAKVFFLPDWDFYLHVRYCSLWKPEWNLLACFWRSFSLLKCSNLAQLVKNLPAMQETPVQFLGGAIHSSIPAWRTAMDRGAWWATVYRVQRVGHDWMTKHSTQAYESKVPCRWKNRVQVNLWVGNNCFVHFQVGMLQQLLALIALGKTVLRRGFTWAGK